MKSSFRVSKLPIFIAKHNRGHLEYCHARKE